MLGSIIGIDAYGLATQYFDGTVIPEPASLALLFATAPVLVLRSKTR